MRFKRAIVSSSTFGAPDAMSSGMAQYAHSERSGRWSFAPQLGQCVLGAVVVVMRASVERRRVSLGPSARTRWKPDESSLRVRPVRGAAGESLQLRLARRVWKKRLEPKRTRPTD